MKKFFVFKTNKKTNPITQLNNNKQLDSSKYILIRGD